MYVQLMNFDKKDDKFSYLLSKNPANTFDRVKKGQRLIGSYNNCEEFQSYEMYIHNDSIEFLTKLKKMNFSSYLNYEEVGVCPYNLKGFYEILRTAFSTTNREVPEEVYRDKNLGMTIGPFKGYKDKFESFFEQYGFSISFEDNYGKCEESFFISVFKSGIPLYLFLRQVYIICYFLTEEYNLNKLNKDIIEKYIKMTEEWIFQSIEDDEDKLYYAKQIIRVLCRNHKTYMQKFIDSIGDIEEEIANDLKDKLYIGFKSAHHAKHLKIADIVTGLYLSKGYKTIIDYGCGEGSSASIVGKSLLDVLQKGYDKSKFQDEITLLSYDVKDKRNRFNKFWSGKFYQMNLLYPNKFIIPEQIDVLVLSEVIEHFNREERQQLLDIITNILSPKYIVITTPNKDYNKIFGMGDHELRHPDHKIEYKIDDFREEVLSVLYTRKYFVEKGYLVQRGKENIKEWKVIDIDFETITEERLADTSHFFYVLKNESGCNQTRINNNFYDSVYLPVSDYRINRDELSSGYSDRAYMKNYKNIFYMSPTVPPVDYMDIEDDPGYLEHPESAFKYYENRGINTIYYQKKYMGSRANIIVFRTFEHAIKMGFSTQIVVNSRNGYSMFYEDVESDLYKSFIEDLEKSLFLNINYDYFIFDAEMMPWSYKAKGLIAKEFQGPGEAFYLDSLYYSLSKLEGLDTSTDKSEEFLKTLSRYTKDESLYFRIFDILSAGYINKNSYSSEVLGFLTNTLSKTSLLKDWLESSTFFKPIETFVCTPHNRKDVVKEWKDYCANKEGEGYVFKIGNPLTYNTANGYPIQPMLKVRGKEYLQLIYGINYLKEDHFNMLKNRRIAKKRLLAIQQHELGNMILRAFLNGKEDEKNRLVAGFMGTEKVSFGNIDKTL